MILRHCPNRHYYDGDIYEQCPYCKGNISPELDEIECAGFVECIFGENKGNVYKLHKGINHVGTSYQMDVRIGDDLQVTYDNHCSIICDIKGHFIIVPSAGTITYVNNKILKRRKIIRKTDVFRIGRCDYRIISTEEG